jgi:iron complex transport system substrate-binding protein
VRRAQCLHRRAVLGAGLVGALAGLFGAAGCGRSRRVGHGVRVVSLTPNTTETLFAVGAGAVVVGRSRFCDFPPEVRSLPQVGGYVDPSFEAILALAPTLVTGARGPAGRALSDRLEGRGIATYVPPTESMAEIDAMIEGLGERVGHAAEGKAKAAEVRAARAKVAAAVAGKPRPRVLMIFGLSPISAAGPGSFADELLTLAGGQNAVTRAAASTAYPQLGLEQVLALDPDVVLDAAMMEHRVDGLGPTWSGVRAVREGRVASLTSDVVLRPGPRVADGAAEVARFLHPDAVL